MVTSNNLYKPYENTVGLPTLFQWEERSYGSHPFLRNAANGEEYRGTKRDIQGFPACLPNSSWIKDANMRELFFGLGFISFSILTIVRVVTRVFWLFTADFVRVAQASAEKEWEVDWIKSALNPEKNSAPSIHMFRFKVLAYALFEFILEMCKIVTYPLAGIFLSLSAFWGAIVDSADGGALWALVERTWGRSPAYFSNHKTWIRGCPGGDILTNISDYLLFCRQPIWFVEATGMIKSDHRRNIRGLIYQLKTEINAYREHFSLLGINCEAFLGVLKEYRDKKLLAFSPYCDEFAKGVDKNLVSFHFNELLEKLNDLRIIRMSWQQHIEALQKGQATTRPSYVQEIEKIKQFSLEKFPSVFAPSDSG